jgi:hypothetical protein
MSSILSRSLFRSCARQWSSGAPAAAAASNVKFKANLTDLQFVLHDVHNISAHYAKMGFKGNAKKKKKKKKRKSESEKKPLNLFFFFPFRY